MFFQPPCGSGFLLRCRPAVRRNQPHRTSHHHAPHYGRLNTIAQIASMIRPNRRAITDAPTVTVPTPIPAIQAGRR